VTFSVRATGPGTLQYQWQRNGVNISGATSQDYTVASVAQSDNGARFRARVSNASGNVFSNEAVLTVTSNTAPTATITQPAAGTMYGGGSVINYAGTGTDPEDGTLPASAFTWRVDFHHDAHTHPFMPPTSGAQSGSFTIPRTGETSANVWYRIYLTVRDSGGLTHTVQRDIMPRTVTLTLATNPARCSCVSTDSPSQPRFHSRPSSASSATWTHRHRRQDRRRTSSRHGLTEAPRRTTSRRLQSTRLTQPHIARQPARGQVCRRPTSTTAISPAPRSLGSIRQWTSRGDRDLRGQESARTRSA